MNMCLLWGWLKRNTQLKTTFSAVSSASWVRMALTDDYNPADRSWIRHCWSGHLPARTALDLPRRFSLLLLGFPFFDEGEKGAADDQHHDADRYTPT
jgi:hypothetical protein